MYIAYLDDSNSRGNKSGFQVMSAVVMHDDGIRDTEIRMAISLYTLLPEDQWEKFKEFKACELFGGYGVFEGIEQAKRFEAIKHILELLSASNVSIVYGAVNQQSLSQTAYGSAEPIDICFRICMKGVNELIRQKSPTMKALLISDDYASNKALKEKLSASYRQFRWQLTKAYRMGNLQDGFWNLHDALYFGDSTDSVGLQLADLCSYFIAQHLDGGKPEAEGFYEMISKHIVHSKIEPK